MTENKLKGPAAVNHLLSDRDFGDPKPKKGEIPAIKKIYIGENPYRLKCKKCSKVSYIPTAPIEVTTELKCSCGHKLATLADKSYGEKQRKNKINSPESDTLLDSQII